MRRFQLFSIGVLAVVGVMLMAVSGASAAKLLTVTEAGEPVTVGHTADVGLSLESCFSFNNGSLTANHASKVTAAATANAAQECGEEGFSETGVITSAQLTGSGKAGLKGKLEISMPGPCVYKYTSFKGVFEVPGEVFIIGTVTGKLNKKPSSESCEKTKSTTFIADLTGEPFGERFGDHL